MLYGTREKRLERRWRFDELKRLHRPRVRRFGWTQALGLGLIGVAVTAAFGGEYPISRDIARPASAATRVYLLPEGVDPASDRPLGDWEFAWSWAGPQVHWDLVLLDASFAPVARMTDIRGHSVRPHGAMRATLREPGLHYWFVESELEGHPFRSTPRELPQPR